MLVATAAVAFIVRSFRVSPSQLRGWIGKNLFILAVLAGAYLYAPKSAGYLASGLFLGLVLLPTTLQRFVVRASLQQRHRRARRIANVVRFLHPFDGFWQQSELFRGLEAAQRGDVNGAAECFDRLRNSKSMLSRVAAMHYFRITEQWEELARWTMQMGKEGELARNPTLLVHYLRSLGEIGKIEELVQTYQRFRASLERGAPASVRLTVLAFSGRRLAVERLLAASLGELPESVKSLWRATSDFAAGDAEQARELLEGLLAEEDGTIRSQARYRLDHPPPVAAEMLTPQAQELLATLEQELEQEERYKPSHAGLWKRARVTWALIALSVLVFGAEVLAGGSTDAETLLAMGAVDAKRVLAGEVWRLLTATFLHFGPLHLLVNMIGLVLFGPFVERALGGWRFLWVYLVAGIGAMSAVVVKASLLGQDMLLVGASGGIMGLLGATGYLLARGWRKERARPAKAQLQQIVVILVLQTVFDLSIKEISFMAHFAGMLIGFAACFVLARSTHAAK